jgi:hypothetical protein
MGPNQPPVSMGTGCSSLEVKQPGSTADDSPLSSTVVKNEWNYTSTLPICLYGVYRDFIFTTVELGYNFMKGTEYVVVL